MDSGCRAATRKPYRSRRLCSLHQPCRSKAEGRFRLTAVRLGGAKIGLSVQPRLCFWNGVGDNFPAKKIAGLEKCTRVVIAKDDQIFRLQHNNVILLVASDRYLSPRRANKTFNRH
jgi:hypothetical protein